MILLLLRGLFVLMAATVAALYGLQTFANSALGLVMSVIITLAVTSFVILVDVMTPRKKLSAVSGVFLGLIVGMLAAYALSFIVDFVNVLYPNFPRALMEGVKVFIGVVCVYVCITLVLQTKDDFRFVIPYVEFTKQIRGARPLLLDSSAIIDGRILDISETQFLQGTIIVPRFVLNELQALADSQDKNKRARGRRGLDMVWKLQANRLTDVNIDDSTPTDAGVDQSLLSLAKEINARLVTTDYNLNKVGKLRGIEVLNINDLAKALKPAALPGQRMKIKLIRAGESPQQAVGYLEDGTMVVVENGRPMLEKEADVAVTSSLQTSAGRMLFARLAEEDE